MASVFISYSTKDSEFARKLVADLEALGHAPWLDDLEIRVGESIPLKVSAALAETEYVIVLLSKHSVASGWVQREWSTRYWDEVAGGRALVLPVLIEDCDIPALLKTKKYADFRTNYSLGLVHLTAAISPIIASAPAERDAEVPRSFADVTSLISKVNRSDANLAECVADALAVAQNRNSPELAAFCKRELSGYRGLSEDELEALQPEHRLREGLFSTTAKLNAQFIGWGGDVSQLLAFARKNKRFFAWKVFVPDSLSRLQEQATAASPNTVIQIEMTLGGLLPEETEHQDVPVTGYFDPRSYQQILEGIRQQLLTRLFKLLP